MPYGPAPRQRFDLFAGSSASGAVPCVHPRGVLAAQHARGFRLLCRGRSGPRLVDGAARLHARAGSDADRDCRRNQARARLARCRRREARHRRGADRRVRLVRGRAPHGDGARPSAGRRRPRDLRHLRACADPRHLSRREAAADRRRDRDALSAAAPRRHRNRSRSPMAPRSFLRWSRTAAIFMRAERRRMRQGRCSRSPVPIISPFWRSCGAPMESWCEPRSISSEKLPADRSTPVRQFRRVRWSLPAPRADRRTAPSLVGIPSARGHRGLPSSNAAPERCSASRLPHPRK